MLKTHIVQPLYHSNQRTEFRVSSKGKVLMPNLRLCNFGVSTITAGGAGGVNFDNLCFAGGCLSLIKNIVLYSGNIILDQISDADQWLGISSLVSSATAAYDLKQNLVGSNLNLLSLDDGDLRHSLAFQVPTRKLLGRVNLQDIFPFLSAQAVGPKGQIVLDENGQPQQLEYLADFDDLRLVVEYHTDGTHIFAASDMVNARPTAWTISQPEMVFEEVVDEALAAEITKDAPIRFNVRSIERERLDITAIGSTRLRGFDGKQLTNLVLQTLPAANTADAVLCYAYSALQAGEKMQVVVNGRKLLPFQGADTAARKSALFADSVGAFISFTGTTDINFGARNAAYAPVYSKYPAQVLGKLSLMGVSVLDTVSQLEVEYSNSLAVFTPIQIWAWAEVLKFVSKDKGTGAIQTGYITA